jgi:hypothetical protein
MPIHIYVHIHKKYFCMHQVIGSDIKKITCLKKWKEKTRKRKNDENEKYNI